MPINEKDQIVRVKLKELYEIFFFSLLFSKDLENK